MSVVFKVAVYDCQTVTVITSAGRLMTANILSGIPQILAVINVNHIIVIIPITVVFQCKLQ